MPKLGSSKRILVSVVAMVMALGAATIAGTGTAWAEKQDARKHYDRATAAFGLGRYAEAASEYEAAFMLRPDPALLYNCAQSYRLADNKPRALELYRNYVRLYGDAPNADDARKHVNDIEAELSAPGPLSPAPVGVPGGAATPRGAMPAPGSKGGPSAGPALTAPPTSPTAPAMGASAALPPAIAPDVHVNVPAPATTDGATPEPPRKSLVSRPWFWAVIGAAVVGGTVAVIVAASGDKDPKPSLGAVAGN